MPEWDKKSTKSGNTVTLVGVLVNVLLILFKFFAGLFGHSQALIADAVHSISDFFTDVVVLVGLKVSRKVPDLNHPFGHARIETLASALVGTTLIATAVFLGIRSSWDIYGHTEHHPTWLAVFGAGLSILLKETLFQYTRYVGRKINSPLVLANAWHHRSDAFSSVAVLFGVTAAQVKDSWHILDAYAALIVSFFILKAGLQIITGTIREFIDTAPDTEIISEIRKCALSQPGVLDVHDLRVRTSGGLYQMEAHIGVDEDLTVAEGHRISKAVECCLMDEIKGIDRIIIHVDPATVRPGK